VAVEVQTQTALVEQVAQVVVGLHLHLAGLEQPMKAMRVVMEMVKMVETGLELAVGVLEL
jgi:hypothetical protein